MISDRLLALARCPECRGGISRLSRRHACDRCGREFTAVDGQFLDLRPVRALAGRTKYLDDALHADGRHERVSPPLLSAGVRHDVCRRLLPVAAHDRVLDVGCGSGRFLFWLRDTGAYLAGVDVSPRFAAEARERIDLAAADLRRLPFADGAFTKAISLDVMEHLTPEGVRAMLAETWRVLAKDGRFFLYTHVRRTSRLACFVRGVNRFSRLLDRVGLIDLSRERLRKSDHRNPLRDHDELRRVAAESGFRIARIRYYTPLVGSVVENVLQRLAERWLIRRNERRAAACGSPADRDDAFRLARREAGAMIAGRGVVYRGLRLVTRMMRLDVTLFGRIESGPFFAVLVKDEKIRSSGRDRTP